MPIRVWNPTAIDTAPLGTQVPFVFDHLSFVARGARLDGKDVRLYSVRDGVTKELHRVLDPRSSWNQNATKLWFRVDGAVDPLATQEDIYFLVFEAKDSPPLEDSDQVFALYDDFNQPSLDLAKWKLKMMLDASGVVQDVNIVNGELALSAGPSSPGAVSIAGVRSRSGITTGGLAVESSLRFEMHSSNKDCTLENITGLWTHQQDRARAVWQRGGNVWHVLNDTDQGTVSRIFLNSRPSTGDSRHFLLRWSSPTVKTYANGVHQGDVKPASTFFKTPASGPLNVGFATMANGLVCSDRASKLWVDWVFARQIYSDRDLEATFLGPQEVTKL